MKPSRVILPTSLVLVAAFACSSPPSQPAQGSFTITVEASGGQCPATGGPLTVSSAANPQDGYLSLICQLPCKPSAHEVVDGDKDYQVSCTVQKQADGKFHVEAQLSQGASSIGISGSIGPTGGPAYFSSNSAAAGTHKDTACNIIIEPNKGQITDGAIWARFQCDNFEIPSSAGQNFCKGSGSFIFENCSK